MAPGLRLQGLFGFAAMRNALRYVIPGGGRNLKSSRSRAMPRQSSAAARALDSSSLRSSGMTMVGVLRPRRVETQVGAKDFSPLPMTYNPLGAASPARQPTPTRTPAQDLRFLAALRPRNDMVGARQAIFMVMTEAGALRPRRVETQVGAKDFSPLPMTHIPWARHPRPGSRPRPGLRLRT